MEINWFPGHMAKSTREIEASVKSCDCVVYVLDSRAVKSCFNPKFDGMITVPIVYLLNKCDTVEKDVTDGWAKRLTVGKNYAVATNGADAGCRKRLIAAIKRACGETLERQKRRGLNAHVRAVVVGVPNTGKSTVINTLCGKARLNTGNRAGVTKSTLWARVDETLDVLDTPGTLYPKISDRRIGENLAIIGSIKDEVIDKTELALALIERLNGIDELILTARYGRAVDVSGGLETVAEARGLKIRGGEPDTDRAAALILDDFRKGRMGKIALERSDDNEE